MVMYVPTGIIKKCFRAETDKRISPRLLHGREGTFAAHFPGLLAKKIPWLIIMEEGEDELETETDWQNYTTFLSVYFNS